MALLASLLFPACARSGIGALPPARCLDPQAIVGPKTASSALAGPARFAPNPEIETPLHHTPPAMLFADRRKMVAGEKHSYPRAVVRAQLRVDYLVRRAVFNVPGPVTAQVLAGPGRASAWLALWSRSVYERSDFGVNRQRVRAWLASLATTAAHTK